LFEPVPIKLEDITAYNYRVESCVNQVTKNQIKMYRLFELKKMMVKSKKMQEYFEEHPTEKQIIQKDLIRLNKLLSKSMVKMAKIIPDYLYPSFLKKEKKDLKGRIKILVHPRPDPEELRKSLRKRMMKESGDDFDEEEFEKKFKKINSGKGRYIRVNVNKEDPTVTDALALKPTGANKLWKKQHNIRKKFTFQDKK